MIAMERFFQQEAWDRLASQLERLPHPLLLHGPQGVGKLHLAERFAQLLLCEARGHGTTPCGRCDGCRWFLAGQHPDVRFIEPETIARQVALEDSESLEKPKGKPSAEIRIEQIRGLADFLYIGSHRGGRRVAVVHPAEAMNAHASNALLKSLEEPPAGAVFLLVSHRPARLLPTIRSRCIPASVPLPDAGAAQAWLQAQGVPEVARRLAFAGGAPLRALEDASSERGALADEILRAIASRDVSALRSPKDRDGLEILAEALQKCAFDGALASFGLPPKYTSGMASERSESRDWLAYARKMGRDRALARHPLNVGLHAAEMLAGLPDK
jgi:DNA polymerase-3 subunit delta'